MAKSEDEILDFQKGGIELINKLPALIVEGIPVMDEMWKKIQEYFPYMENTESLMRPNIFDYVNLSTDEISMDPYDTKSIIREYKELMGRSWLSRSMFYWLTHSSRKERQAYIDKERAERQVNQELGLSKPYLTRKSQEQNIDFTLARISLSMKDPNILSAISEICKNPEKPFLIVYGHGGASFETNRQMIIGEQYGEQVLLRKVFERMAVQSDKYSLIILESCNADGIKPPLVSAVTPIFYVEEGLADILSSNKSGFLDPRKK